MTNNLYSLKLFDNSLLTFSMSNEGLSGFVAHICKVDPEGEKLLPPDMQLSDRHRTGRVHARPVFNGQGDVGLSAWHAAP